ncbi:MAG: DUF2442 domain-containing protein [bacterium]
MYWDVKKVVAVQGCKLYLEMEDGRSGYFDVTPLLKNKFFWSLKDPNYFKQVKIVLGALTWPNEEDIDPEIVMKDFVPEPCSCVAEKRLAYGEV